jgi:beta-galactosidase
VPGLEEVGRGRLLFGGDYNPEQWPEEVWHEDLRLMRAAGVNLVTVGVFSWARIEPRPGARDFGWLDRVMELLHGGGIMVDLATATAAPPPWLGHRWPETLPVDADGRRLWYGARGHFCPSAPAYRERAIALVTDIAARYAGHPGLAMWHVGNEYGEVCWCDRSAAHFRRWLQARYRDLDSLNDAWATAFWSQHYSEWDEVLPPRRAPYLVNPTQQLDFQRFCSDALLELFLAERQVLRRLTPGVPVTTNFMGLFKPVDYWAWAAHEDVVAHDWYGDPADPRSHVLGALGFDLMRSLGGGRPWMLMEQAPSAVNWRRRNPPKRPGQMRLWSLQAVARGADAVCYFQWRASGAGAEKFHSGMVPHAGEDTRVHREIREHGIELQRLGEVVGARLRADVAVVLDWHSWWAAELDSHPSWDLRVVDRLLAWYRPLWEAGILVDLAHPSADLSAYAAVVVPNLYLVDDTGAASLRGYVERGGTLVMGFFSGVVDERDHVRLGGYPAPFRELLGLRVEEHWPLREGETVTCASALLGRFEGRLWAERLRAEGAEAVATIAGGDLDGVPAVLRNSYGAGTAWYVATQPDDAGMAALLQRVCGDAGVAAPLPGLPRGVEVVARGEVVFLLNHTEEPVMVTLAGARVDLLTGAWYDGLVPLGRFGVAALRAAEPTVTGQ